jgi:hypothetical protein
MKCRPKRSADGETFYRRSDVPSTDHLSPPGARSRLVAPEAIGWAPGRQQIDRQIMKYFPHVPNLHINADGYLKGFLGLDWFPSDAAKAQVDKYEKKVAGLLFRMWNSYTASWIMWEISSARPKRVDIVPSEFAPDEFKANESGGDTAAKTGPKDGSYVDAAKAGTPGKACLPEKKSDRVEGTGKGADTVVAFRPEAWGASGVAGNQGPGSAADEILIHELFHAGRHVRGVTNRCFGAPRDWGDYEEFLAVTVCNVFSSETRRPLRAGHLGFQALPDRLKTSAAFLGEFKDYLKSFRSDHPHLFGALKKATGIPFNPFALM